MKLGNHTAINGGKSDCSAMTPKTLSKNTKTMAIQMPTARFTPIPPLLFIDETATAIMVNMKQKRANSIFYTIPI